MNRIKNSWNLLKASASVLSADKELILFPIVSSIGVIIVTLSFALPMFFAGVFEFIFSQVPGSQIMGFIILFMFYVFQYFVIIFSNSALVGAAMMRLQGKDPGIRDGFRIAFQHIGSIFIYALISATVGVVLRTISERSNALGRFVISLIGLGWNIATFLVVPILVIEDVGPIDAIKRSVSLLKKTWGEQIVGNIGIGLIFGLTTVAILTAAIPLTVLSFIYELYWLGVLIILLMIVTLTILSLINGALNGIFTAAVYQYAVEGQSSTFFEPQLIEDSFRVRR